jgi:hypothetical protein
VIGGESPRTPQRHATSWLLALLALCSAACGRVYEYPDSESEASAPLCTDGMDNDYDGDTDCDDADCDGSCPETTRLTCSDGRDNDGDGVTDTSDPRCWSFQLPLAERCGTASGIDIFDGFDQSSVGYPVFLRGDWPWLSFGDSANVGIAHLGPHLGGQRRDWLAMFTDSTRANVGFVDSGSLRWLDSSLGVLIRQLPFSGSFQDLELAFDVYLPAGALLRAAIVPVEAAPSESAPLPGAENALVSVLVDTSQSPPDLVLTVRGVPSRR